MQALLIPGTYLIPGLGQIAITTTLTILLGKTIIETGTEVFNKVIEGLEIILQKRQKKQRIMYQKD